MGTINLAHGDLAVIGAYLAIVVIPLFGLPPLLAFVVVVPAAFAILGYLGQRTLIQAALDRGPLTTSSIYYHPGQLLAEGVLKPTATRSTSARW